MTYYFFYSGGLGDVFNQLYRDNSLYLLENLNEKDYAFIITSSHNPYIFELFFNHPKRKQFQFITLPYWNPKDDLYYKKLYRLDKITFHNNHGQKNKIIKFYPFPEDEIIEDKYIILALGAGHDYRSIPENIALDIVREMHEYKFILTGRNFARNNKREPIIQAPNVINMIDKLTVPGTAAYIKNSIALVTCHSSLNILGWHMNKPQLLLYPEQERKEFFTDNNEWSFGKDFPNTVHCTFDNFDDVQLKKFKDICNTL